MSTSTSMGGRREGHTFVGWDAGAVGSSENTPQPVTGASASVPGWSAVLSDVCLSHESRRVDGQTRPCARAHAVASAANATITPPGRPLAGQPPHPPSPGDLVSVITVLIFVREAGEGIPIAQWRPACLLSFFFFFFSRRDPIQILPDNELKQTRRPKQNKPTAKALLLPGAEPRTSFCPHTLGPRGPRTRWRVRHFPPPANAALIPPK